MGSVKSFAVATAAALVVGVPTAAFTYTALAGGSSSAVTREQPAPTPTLAAPDLDKKTDPFLGQTLATRDFPTNSHGQTYGSDAEADMPEQSPDLVAVAGDNGVAGYVLKEDLAGPIPKSPEEAAALPGGDQVLKVYDVEGEKVVDTFTLVEPTTATGEEK